MHACHSNRHMYRETRNHELLPSRAVEMEAQRRDVKDQAVNTDESLMIWPEIIKHKNRVSPTGASRSLHTSSSTNATTGVKQVYDVSAQHTDKESLSNMTAKDQEFKENAVSLPCLASSVSSQTDEESLKWSMEVQVNYPGEDQVYLSDVQNSLKNFSPNMPSSEDAVWLAFMTSAVRRMRGPSSGLEIKPRKWLKRNIADSALGTDIVRWLFAHYAFGTKKAAKRFAQILMLYGYLKHFFYGKLRKFKLMTHHWNEQHEIILLEGQAFRFGRKTFVTFVVLCIWIFIFCWVKG